MSRVGGRGYPPDDYDERDRDRDYSGGPRRRPVYDEVDVDIRNTRRAPDFLREDYGRVNNAELVVRGNRRLQSPESDSPPPPSRRRPKERLPPIEREEIDIDIRREREPERRRPPRREFEEEEVVVRRRQIPDDPPPPRERDPPPREEIDIDIRREERQGQRQRPREEEIEVDIRREERRPRPRPPRELEREEEPPRQRRREKPVEEIDIDIRREGSERPRRPRPWEEEIDINIKREDPRERVKETIIYREPSPPRHVAREREEFIYRRREPERPPVIEKEEIIVRRIRSPSPESSPSPPPPAPPSLEPVTRPPIVQEVITHYRNIDHGMVRAQRSPSSSPSPPPPPKQRDERLEIEIRRRDERGRTYTEDIRLFDEPTTRSRPRSAKPARMPSPPSPPPPPRQQRAPPPRVVEREEIDINIDDYYTRKASALVELNERSKPANNVDRSLAIRVASAPPAVIAPVSRAPPREMWTEITKDLVTKEGIESLGYQYEETEEFFYVMEYLRYEDVAHLVAVSDNLSVDRRERIEQIQWERKDPRLQEKKKIEEGPMSRRASPAYYDEQRIYEREVVYDRRGPGGRR